MQLFIVVITFEFFGNFPFDSCCQRFIGSAGNGARLRCFDVPATSPIASFNLRLSKPGPIVTRYYYAPIAVERSYRVSGAISRLPGQQTVS